MWSVARKQSASSLQLSYSLSINLAIVESCTFVVPSYMVPDEKETQNTGSCVFEYVTVHTGGESQHGGDESLWHLALTLGLVVVLSSHCHC